MSRVVQLYCMDGNVYEIDGDKFDQFVQSYFTIKRISEVDDSSAVTVGSDDVTPIHPNAHEVYSLVIRHKFFIKQIDLQMPRRRVKLKGSDGEIVEADEDIVANCFLTIKQMLGFEYTGVVETDDMVAIPPNAPHITGDILHRIINWAINQMLEFEDISAVNNENRVAIHPNAPHISVNLFKRIISQAFKMCHQIPHKAENESAPGDDSFLQVDGETLFELLRAANYLNVEDLQHGICKTVANIMKGMSAKNIRLIFHIPNDLAPAQKKQAAELLKWTWVGDNFWQSPLPGKNMIINFNDANWNDEDGNAILDCLHNPHIVEEICQHFSSGELLEFSCVNQVWNSEAQRLVKSRGNLVARIPNSNCQKYFDQFGSFLEKLKDNLFSGLVIELFSSDHDRTCSTGAKSRIADKISTGMSCRCLKLLVHENWFNYFNCPSYRLAERVLKDFRGNLEELVLEIHTGREEFINEILQLGDNDAQDLSFPALKIFKLQGIYHYSDPYENCSIMNALAGRAPNLDEIHMGAMLAAALVHRNFNFNQAFPKLSRVLIFGHNTHLEHNPLSELIQEANVNLRRQPLQNLAVSVHTLGIINLDMSNDIIEFFAQMFPSVDNISAKQFTDEARACWERCYIFKPARPRVNRTVIYFNTLV